MLARVKQAASPISPVLRSPVQLGSREPWVARLVQDRIALFGKTMFWIAMFFLAMAGLFRALELTGPYDPGRESHAAATLIAFAVWQLGRMKQTLSPGALLALDCVGTISLCVLLVLMGYYLSPVQPWGFFAGTLAVFHTITARAVIVPSTPRRTALITAACFAGLVISANLLFVGPSTESSARWLTLIGPLGWSSTGTALATLASSVIYGLRVEVAKAQQLGQYTLERKIGAGGMGEVYRARHALLRRPTAIKLIAGDVSEAQVHRFEQEVQLTASLTHPNTISIYDFGHTPDGTFYYAMELLDGLTLQEVVERDGAQPPSRVIHILLQVCAALAEAHAAGLIHRDIKPANIFLCRLGGIADVVKVLDFGLVKQLTSDATIMHSNLNTLVGTPLYLSPESITAPEQLDARSDLYALGAVAYFLLSGTPMFSARSVVEICSMHLHTEPQPLSQRAASVPADLERIVHDCLAKRPQDRPSDAPALADRLRACADSGGWHDAQAKAWWQQHASGGSGPTHSASSSGTEATIQIDLQARRTHG
jgi:serine/threonine-protein kinase